MNHIRTTSRTRRAVLAVFLGAALVAALAGTAGSSSGAVVTSGVPCIRRRRGVGHQRTRPHGPDG